MAAIKRVLLGAVLLATSVASIAAANSWTARSSRPTLTSPQSLVVDPTNSAVVYLIDSVYTAPTVVLRKSVDGGVSWTTLYTSSQIAGVAIDPVHPSTLYLGIGGTAGGGAGLYKSTDGGATWTLSNFGLVTQIGTVFSMAFDPLDSSVLYAVMKDGLYKSGNGASSWSRILSATDMGRVAVDAGNRAKIYAAAYNNFYRSADAGSSWNAFAFDVAGAPPADLIIDPSDSSTLYLAGGNDRTIFKSTDAGQTWVRSNFGILPCFTNPNTVSKLAVVPGSQTTLFAATFCGVYRSLDAGRSWARANSGLPITSFSLTGQDASTVMGIGNSASDPNRLYASALSYNDNGVGDGGVYEYVHDASILAPTCYLSANPATVAEGGSSTLSAYCSPAATTYAWSTNTGFAASASGGTVFPTQTTTYTVQGINANGASNLTSVTVAAPGPRLLGISTRAQVLTGDGVLIAGIAVGGSTAKSVVIRARGPSLGMPGALADPTVTLTGMPGGSVTNNDWQSDPNAGALAASGFAPGDNKEAALLRTLNPGNYTAVVSGVGNTTGLAIVEAYEIDHPETPLGAISTRGSVQGGDNVLIAGFIVTGGSPLTVVIRARGPSVPVANALADPSLQVVSDHGVIATNDDWTSAPNARDIQAAGFAPADPKESALMLTLAPGIYTAIVSGVNSSGIGIVEVFAR